MKKNKVLLSIALVAIVIAASVIGINVFRNIQTSIKPLTKVYGAVGGGKENFLADKDIKQILADDYGIELVTENWSNTKMTQQPLISKATNEPYDFMFPSDQRFFEIYLRDPEPGQAERYRPTSSYVALNTPLVIYSWDTVTEVLIQQGIVTQEGNVYYITDMCKLLDLMLDRTKWSALGLQDNYNNVNINAVDALESSPGVPYYGLMATIYNNYQDINFLSEAEQSEILQKLANIYIQSGFANSTPAVLFDNYISQGASTYPLIMDYEKSIIELKNSYPLQYEAKKDSIRMLYPKPTTWNSHAIHSFTANGDIYVQALKDPKIQKIAFEKYGFRTQNSLTGYNVEELGIKHLPNEITNIVPLLKEESYQKILQALRSKLEETTA